MSNLKPFPACPCKVECWNTQTCLNKCGVVHNARKANDGFVSADICRICHDKKYLISTRDDGYEAVEACDNCVLHNLGDVLYLSRDAIAAQLAERDGIAALHDYPCYVIGKTIGA